MNVEMISLLERIKPIDCSVSDEVQAHLDDLTHPAGSLGRLEDLAMQYCRVRRSSSAVMGRKRIYTFAADHGIADRGVSTAPKVVTQQMVMNMVGGGAAVSVLSRHAGVESVVVDVGIDGDLAPCEGLLIQKVRRGTNDLSSGPAMSVDDAEQAVLVGAKLAHQAVADGVTILGTGEMGIGNTSPSSCLFAALLDCPIEDVTGRGTGIDDETLERKINLLRSGLEVNASALSTPLEALAAVGGLEIAGLCGLILGAASEQVVVVVDGFISAAAALVAWKLKPEVRDYMVFSHHSAEKGYNVFAELTETRPLLDLDFRLGEGTGAALAIGLIDAAMKVYYEMATFSGAGVESCD